MQSKLEKREEELKRKIEELQALYNQTGSPMDQKAMINVTEELIILQKERIFNFQRAHESIMNLEREIGKLPDEIFYRKAVLAFENEKYNQAESWFRELIDRPNIASWLQERTKARLAATLIKLEEIDSDRKKHHEAWSLWNWVLENAEDSEALAIIRSLDREMDLEQRILEKLEDQNELSPENVHYVYRSFDPHEHPISSKEEREIRNGLPINQFDFYLDYIKNEYYIRGRRMNNPNKYLKRFLFARIYRPNDDRTRDLIPLLLDDVVPGELIDKKTRNRFDQNMQRIRYFLKMENIDVRRYQLPSDLTYCLLFDGRWYFEVFR